MSFKHILVPADFSTCSGAALDYALNLAQTLGASVEVLHAYEVPTFVPPHVVVAMGEIEASLSEHAEREALKQLDEFLTLHKVDPGIQREVRLGPAATIVLERLEEGGIDLVVMGTHGRTGVARWFLGSTAEKVVRGASVPVLTIRETETSS